ncbi:MAG: NAD(P)/FAD-dependent oxidoreductase [Acholeplasmatales bacterium]|jgi:predicted Rossmann fold flavoprotein|nr:NAD(P)/FAD-dependent oxidoreductase [Acholeplasmatales bacterium]
MKLIDYMIIGAGPSGLTAAIKIKEKYPSMSVCIVDKNKTIARKIKASGNGRCNIGSKDITKQSLNDLNYQKEVFNENNYNYFISFLKNDLNIELSYEDNSIYPYSKMSQSVVNAYADKIKDLDIKIIFDDIISFKNETNFISVQSHDNNYLVKKLILSAGGKSYYKDYNNDKGIIKTLKTLNVKFKDFIPGLTGYILKEDVNSLFGVRLECSVQLVIDDKIIFSEDGEVNFKKDGIGGIVIMNSSNLYQSLENKKNVKLLIKPFKNDNITNIKNNMNDKLYDYLLSKNKVVNKNNSSSICFVVDNVYGFDYAQVSIGGVLLSEINHSTYNLLKYENIYVLGELLDVCGVCGGYNIMHSIISALLLAKNI